MNVNEAFDLVNFIANKKQSGAIGGDEYNLALLAVNMELFVDRAGLPEDYRPGQPLSARGYQITTTLSDELKHLIIEVDINKTITGHYPYPAAPIYGVFSSLRYGFIKNNKCGQGSTKQMKRVELVTDGELSERLDSHLLKPTLKRPIAAYYQPGWRVSPEEIKQVHLTYLKEPATPVRSFFTANDQETYVQGTSVQFEWPNKVHNNLVTRICNYFGINIREHELQQWAERKQQTGV